MPEPNPRELPRATSRTQGCCCSAPGDPLEVLTREVAMASHKHTCFMLTLPNPLTLDSQQVSTGTAAIPFPFAIRKSKLVKIKCATSPDFPQNPFHSKPDVSFR